jgi:hypothetical protein
MSTPDRRLQPRRGLRTRSCFNGHDVSPARLRVVAIGAASIVVCGPACEAEARARILRRIHGSPVAALRQALSDWRGGTGPAGAVLALLDLLAEEATARASVLKLAQEAVHTARDRRDAALETALAAQIWRLNRPELRANASRLEWKLR